MPNKVFIATSLDGYIAGKDNQIDWLETIPNPDNNDMGYSAHMDNIDALVMGRNTMELVANMDMDWPYTKPVFVISNTLTELPDKLKDRAFLIKGEPATIDSQLKDKGYNNLYIDGGRTIQSFLQADLIDEMIITTIPILLGGGIALFGDLEKSLEFRCAESIKFDNGICQNRYVRFKG